MLKKNLILLSLIGIMAISSVAYAGFFDLGVGARPLGMGHAFVAVADDVNAVYYNPAGLINITSPQLTFMYAPIFIGLTDGSGLTDFYGAFAMRLGPESAAGGAWVARYCVGGEEDANLSLLQENSFYGSYAMWVFNNLAVGLNAKILMHTYGQDIYAANGLDDVGNATGTADSTFANGYSKIGFSIDAGALYFLNERLTAGVLLQNIIPMNMALSSNSSVTDPAPMYLKCGIGYKIPEFSMMENIILTSDFVYHLGGVDNDIKLHSGLEAWFFTQSIAARFGFGVGTNRYSDISVGGSYVVPGPPQVQIDYSWNCPLSGIKIGGNHRLSCTIKL